MWKSLFIAAVLACAAAGCKTQTALTADATGCRVTEVDVLKSRYSRQGSTSVWCATCKGKTYHCVSNADRNRVECQPAVSEDVCS